MIINLFNFIWHKEVKKCKSNVIMLVLLQKNNFFIHNHKLHFLQTYHFLNNNDVITKRFRQQCKVLIK